MKRLIVCAAVCGSLFGQIQTGPPLPYRVVENWPQLPKGWITAVPNGHLLHLLAGSRDHLAAGCLDDEFLTLSPVVVGSAPDAPRPGLIEGVTFPASSHPRSRPVTLHRAGDLLFLRSRYAFP